MEERLNRSKSSAATSFKVGDVTPWHIPAGGTRWWDGKEFGSRKTHLRCRTDLRSIFIHKSILVGLEQKVLLPQLLQPSSSPLLGITCNKLIFPSPKPSELSTVNRSIARMCRLTTFEHRAATHVNYVKLLWHESDLTYIVCVRVCARQAVYKYIRTI